MHSIIDRTSSSNAFYDWSCQMHFNCGPCNSISCSPTRSLFAPAARHLGDAAMLSRIPRRRPDSQVTVGELCDAMLAWFNGRGSTDLRWLLAMIINKVTAKTAPQAPTAVCAF